MAIFSFRAECQADVDNFKKECDNACLSVSIEVTPDYPKPGFPDVIVEVQADATLTSLQAMMRRVVDGHVMLQTLRECPLKDNSLERVYSLH